MDRKGKGGGRGGMKERVIIRARVRMVSGVVGGVFMACTR